ncbi:hypothetical protein [Micromonospora sp. NPDC023956]|uniref:hypothetical protein n=1 Tax=Micromonospora sp. NPDC023956 TaxID=3155722 RepID=UPI0033E3B2BE
MLIKLALVVVASVVLWQQLAPIGALAAAATAGPVGYAWLPMRLSLVVHAAGGLLVVLAATALTIDKPRGMTRYSYRRTRAGTER